MKAYALALNYEGLQPDGSYIGYVSFYSDGWQEIDGEGTEYSVYIDGNTTAFYALVLIMQIILNITVAAISLKIVPTYVIKCCDQSLTTNSLKLYDPLSAATSLYWSFVISAAFVFLLAQVLAISEQIIVYDDETYRHLLPLKLMVQVVYVFALLVELGWAIYNSKYVKGLHILTGLKYLCWAIFCFRKTELHIRMAVSLSMWVIMVFFLWSIDAFVSMAITAIVYPFAVFFTLCLFLSSWLFLVVFFAAVRHNTHLTFTKHRSYASAVEKLCIIVFATLLFGSVVTILWILQYDNVHASSITGFAVTAAPSVFLSLGAWFMKKRFLKDTSTARVPDEKKASSNEEISLQVLSPVSEIVSEAL